MSQPAAKRSRIKRYGKPEVTFKPLGRNRYRVNGKDGRQFVVKKSMVATVRNSILHRGSAKKPAGPPEAEFSRNGFIDCPHCERTNGRYAYEKPNRPVDMHCSHCRQKFIGKP